MLLTIGKFKRAFLYKRTLGGKNVARVMRNGVQIWPDERDKVRRLMLETPPAGTDDFVYWQHVEAGLNDGVEAWPITNIVGYEDPVEVKGAKNVNDLKNKGWIIYERTGLLSYLMQEPIVEDSPELAGKFALSPLDGRRWLWIKGKVVDLNNVPYALATWDGKGILDFGNDGPYRFAVRAGDYVYVQAEMPERETEHKRGGKLEKVTYEDFLPPLPGTTLYVYGGKGSKKVNLAWRIKMIAQPSGKVLSDQWRYIRGHKRWWNTDHYDVPYDKTCERMDMYYENTEGPSTVEPWLVYPGFKRTFKLKVVDVVCNG